MGGAIKHFPISYKGTAILDEVQIEAIHTKTRRLFNLSDYWKKLLNYKYCYAVLATA